MIIRKTPKNKDKYISVTDAELSYKLQLLGFYPKYIDETTMYFVKNTSIEEFLYGKGVSKYGKNK